MLRTDTPFRLRRIFHPSDFSEASNLAFAHALRLAVAAQSCLTILHTGDPQGDDPWAEFPRVRRTLERWGLLPPNSPPSAIPGIGLDIEKVALPHSDGPGALLDYLDRHPHDLIVLATHPHDGLKRWTEARIAEPLARQSGEMTLFIRAGLGGFVSPADGAATLSSILIPIDRAPDPQLAIDGAIAIADVLHCPDVRVTVLHVGREDPAWEFALPEHAALHFKMICRQGDVERQILQVAAECRAGLIAMAIAGHHGFLNALRGSTAERIVRNAPCPVLAVPADRPAAADTPIVEGLTAGRLTVAI